uniref:Pheromone binding protein 15 n=1 Tax=Cyrtotrachelus buqueti TaxID=1892066 RepID=A0A1L3KPT3_9CUCU|nr:pheromone binding protein 15 [Cyrtotrachelus buqueti]
MKYFILISVLVSVFTCGFAASRATWTQKFFSFTNECIADTGIEADIVQKALQGHITNDPKLKTFLFCMTKKGALQNANGEVQIEEFKKQLPSLVENPETTIELVRKCVWKEGTPEDIALQIYGCFYKTDSNK